MCCERHKGRDGSHLIDVHSPPKYPCDPIHNTTTTESCEIMQSVPRINVSNLERGSSSLPNMMSDSNTATASPPDGDVVSRMTSLMEDQAKLMATLINDRTVRQEELRVSETGKAGGPGNASHSSGEYWNRDTSPTSPLLPPPAPAAGGSGGEIMEPIYIVLWILSHPLIRRSRINRAPQEIGYQAPKIMQMGLVREIAVCVTERTNSSAREQN